MSASDRFPTTAAPLPDQEIDALVARPLLFVGLTTTGADPVMHEIVDLALVQAHPQLLFVQRELVTRVRPFYPERCNSETAARIGFDPERWERAPDIGEALRAYDAIAGGCVLVGHDIGRLVAFLATGFRRAGLELPAPSVAIDTASLSWPLVMAGAVDGVSLAMVCDALCIRHHGPLSARHRAALTMEVYRRLMAGRLAMPARLAFDGDESAILAVLAARLATRARPFGPRRVDDGRNHAGDALLDVIDALHSGAAELVRLAHARDALPHPHVS